MKIEDQTFADPESFRDTVKKVAIERGDNALTSWLYGIEERGEEAANDVFARNISKGFDTVRKIRARVLSVTGGKAYEETVDVEWAKAEHTDPATFRDAVEMYVAQQEDDLIQEWYDKVSLRSDREIIDVYRTQISNGRDSILKLKQYLGRAKSERPVAVAA